MAKKKAARKAPERACEKCGKGYHPRKTTCPHCGAANPTYRAVRTQAPKKSAKKAAAAGDLNTAVEFVAALGGLDEAQAALNTLKSIKRQL